MLLQMTMHIVENMINIFWSSHQNVCLKKVAWYWKMQLLRMSTKKL